MTPKGARSYSLALLALGALFTTVLMLFAMGWLESLESLESLFPEALVFLLWGLVPYGLLAFVHTRFESLEAHLTGLIGSLLVVAGGVGVWVDAFFVRPDAQSGFVFLTLPFVQLCVALILIGLAWAMEVKSRRGGERSR